MTVPLLTDQILEFTFRQTLFDNALINVMHYKPDTPVLPADLPGMGVVFGDVWMDDIMEFMGDRVTMTHVGVQQVWPTVGPLLYGVGSWLGTGGAVAEVCANQLACVVTQKSVDPGRRAQGRMFFGGLPESAFNGGSGEWNAVTYNGLAAGLRDFDNDPAITAVYPGGQVIWSTRSAIAPGPQYYAVLQYLGQKIPATLRTRRKGRGI